MVWIARGDFSTALLSVVSATPEKNQFVTCHRQLIINYKIVKKLPMNKY